MTPPVPHGLRLARLREDMRAAGTGAFVVTHLTNLRYLSGFSGSAGALVVSPEACVLVVDFRYATSARDLDPLGTGEISLELAERSVDDAIVRVLRRIGAVRIGIEAGSMSVARFQRMSDGVHPPSPTGVALAQGIAMLVPTERIVECRRMIKDDVEIAVLREAGRRLAAITLELPGLVRIGRTEVEVAADIETLMRARGFDRPAFETIVASGENGALPHARPSRRVLQPGDGVVVDFGGVYDGYCVDLTRTLQLGEWRPELRRLFDAVAEAHAAALAAVRPGLMASDIDAAARSVLARHGLGEAFGHATGHGLGLEVHEEPRIAKPGASGPDERLQPGMVFTIEPGAYVAGLGGVRIEDDVLVVDGGCELLTAAAAGC